MYVNPAVLDDKCSAGKWWIQGAKISAYNTFVPFILSPSEVTMVLQTKTLQSKWTQVLAIVTKIAGSKAMKVAKLKFAFSN